MASEKINKHSGSSSRTKIKQLMSEFGMESSVEIKGRDIVLVSGCRGIIDFNSKRICFRTDDGMFSVYGAELTLRGFENECIEIRGLVQTVTICENNDLNGMEGDK